MEEDIFFKIREQLGKVVNKLTDITTVMSLVRYGKSHETVLRVSRKYGEDIGESFTMNKEEVKLLLNNIEKLKKMG